MKKTVFLTGANGFIGKNFLAESAAEFAITAPMRSELELADAAAVSDYFSNKTFDCIVHAASKGVARHEQHAPLTCFHTNLSAFTHIFQQRHSAARFIQLGSGSEYGRPLLYPRIREDAFEQHVPQDEYGFSKFICSKMVQTELPAKAVSLQLFGVFGPHEPYQSRFISSAIVQTLLGLPIRMNQDVVFDYLYIKDFISILKKFIEVPAEFSHYNVGSGVTYKLSEIAEMVRWVAGSRNDIIIKNEQLGAEYSCNIDRLKGFLGNDFKFTPLVDAIRELYQWYEARIESLNKEWILNPC